FPNNSTTFTWADNLSWIRGKHSIRTGVFVYTQRLESFTTGLARGKVSFQNFTDFLLGMSATQNGSPQGFSNVQSIEADEVTGTRGEIVHSYRLYHGSVFLEDDVKVASRFTLNLGLRWE